jgi:anti-sigma regulatory factor (Ser/Thr protein kinase)
MTAPIVRTVARCRHDLGRFDSDEALIELVVPFLEEGVSAGDPTFLALDPRLVKLIGAATDLSPVVMLPGADRYERPASTLRYFRELLVEQVGTGADRILIAGALPTQSLGGLGWDGWARYEATVNQAFAELPLWGLCLYDTRLTSIEVLNDAVRTHPRLALGGGRYELNPDFVDPVAFLHARVASPSAAATAPPAARPDVVAVEPSPAEARRIVSRLAARSTVEAAEVAGLVTSVSEAVGNALLHGHPPHLLEGWVTPERVEVAVHDAGPGPDNPFAGLLPERELDGQGGLGLWIAHQLCAEVVLVRSAAGFTIRLVAGTPRSRS